MSNSPFINNRKNAWQRLEDLLARLDQSSLKRLHREEVRELGRIYRRTASDLAVARAESRDPRLINYLNSLVIRAHGRIYRADAQGGERIRGFFARELPRAFRRTWRYTALSFTRVSGVWRDRFCRQLPRHGIFRAGRACHRRSANSISKRRRIGGKG